MLNELVPNDTSVMANGAGSPGPGVPSLRMTSNAASLVISGNPPAPGGPEGNVDGATNSPERKSFLRVVAGKAARHDLIAGQDQFPRMRTDGE